MPRRGKRSGRRQDEKLRRQQEQPEPEPTAAAVSSDHVDLIRTLSAQERQRRDRATAAVEEADAHGAAIEHDLRLTRRDIVEAQLAAEIGTTLSILHPPSELARSWAQLRARIAAAVECRFPGAHTVAIFGSVAAGLATRHSDLDLALLPSSGRTTAQLRGDEGQMLRQLAAALLTDGVVEAAEPTITRSLAPSLIKCRAGSLECDLVVRHGSGGAVAGPAKSALLSAFGEHCPLFRPLAVLIRWWAGRRRICDACAGHLNSFTWALMTAFFLQDSEKLLPPAIDLDVSPTDISIASGWWEDEELLAVEKPLARLLLGFFEFWAHFDFRSRCCSVRLGRSCRVGESPMGQTSSPRTFACEDPIEPDENTARTLAAAHLQELRGELLRAAVVLGKEGEGEGRWAEASAVPRRKKAVELKQYYLLLAHGSHGKGAQAVGAEAQDGVPVRPPIQRGLEVAMTAVVLQPSSRAALLAAFPPEHGNVHARRVRLRAYPTATELATLPLGADVRLRVVAAARDTRCLGVQLELVSSTGTSTGTDVSGEGSLSAAPLVLAVSTAAGTPASYASGLMASNQGTVEWRRLPHTPLVLDGTLAVEVVVDGSAGSKFAEVIEEEELPEAVRSAIIQFASEAGPTAPAKLELNEMGQLPAGQRRSAHQLCEALGLHSRSMALGRTAASKGRKQLEVTKPAGHEPSTMEGYAKISRWLVTGERALPLLLDGGDFTDGGIGLKTVQLLRGGLTVEELAARYKLIVKRAEDGPGLVQLSYLQTESNMGQDVVQECRGLVLDELRDFALTSFPFSKFFNLDEKHAQKTKSQFDWKTARVYEKIDGSLLTLYFHRCAQPAGGTPTAADSGVWRVASSKLPTAAGAMPGSDGKASFADHFWAAFEGHGYALPSCKACCYMFELTSPQHTIVVPHSTRRLRCLGGRDLRTLEEIPCEILAAVYGWQIPSRYDALQSESAVVAAARRLNPVKQEGFVAVDASWRRMKIKSAGYVAIHHLKERPGGSFTSRRLIEIARNNEGDEFLAYFPELSTSFSQAHNALAHLSQRLAVAISGGAGRGNEVELKPLVKQARMKGLTAAEVVQVANIKHVERALGENWMCEPQAEGRGSSRAAVFSVHRGRQAHEIARCSSPKTHPKTPPRDDGASSDEGRAETVAVGNPFAALDDDSSESDSWSSGE